MPTSYPSNLTFEDNFWHKDLYEVKNKGKVLRCNSKKIGFWKKLTPNINKQEPSLLTLEIKNYSDARMAIGVHATDTISESPNKPKNSYAGTFKIKYNGSIILRNDGRILRYSSKYSKVNNFSINSGDLVGINFSPKQNKITFINFSTDSVLT